MVNKIIGTTLLYSVKTHKPKFYSSHPDFRIAHKLLALKSLNVSKDIKQEIKLINCFVQGV